MCVCKFWHTTPVFVSSFEHNFPLLRLMRRVSTSSINCETRQCAIFHLKTLFCTILTYEDVSRWKFSHRRTCMYTTFHIQIMSEIIGLTHAKDCDVYSLWKKSLCATFWLTWTCPHANFSWEDVSVYNLSHNFLRLGSTDMFSTQCVEYKTCSCACSHTKRPVSAHFVNYEVISTRNVKHMTPFWSPNFT